MSAHVNQEQNSVSLKDLNGLPSCENIMLNGGMRKNPLCLHQQVILVAYIEICKQNGQKFAKIPFSKIQGHINSLSKEAKLLIPDNLLVDLTVLFHRELIESVDQNAFSLTLTAKELLKSSLESVPVVQKHHEAAMA